MLARIATEEYDAQIFVDSGDLSLNFYGNTLYFAFKYVGSGKTAQDGTFELDDFRTFEINPKIYITMSYIIKKVLTVIVELINLIILNFS